MATKVSKPVYRETRGSVYDGGKERPIIVSIEPGGVIGFRLKGKRQTYRLTVEFCFMSALKSQLIADKKEKRRLKKEGKLCKKKAGK